MNLWQEYKAMEKEVQRLGAEVARLTRELAEAKKAAKDREAVDD